MGISSFVEHTRKNSFGGSFLDKWKDDGKIVVWLHTLVDPVAVWSHSFCFLDTVEDKESGKQKAILRFPHYVSPDPETVHRNQYFRKDDDDTLRVPPDRDAFLLLREWLRRAEHISLEQGVFRWTNPKNNDVQTWTRGELSGLVKRGRNFGHSLDTKQQYLFAVVRNDAPKDGVFLARETALLGKRIAEVIKQRQEEHGEDGGDPQKHPYSFVWSYDDKAKSPMDSYKAWKGDHELTQDVWDAITSDSPPDLTEFSTPRDGDQDKIRAAMEDAAQVDLPFDEIFSEDPAVRLDLALGRAKARPPTRAAAPPPASAPSVAKPPVPRPAPGPAAARPAASVPATPAQRPAAPAQSSAVAKPGPVVRSPPAAPPAQAARPNGAQRPPPATGPTPPVATPGPASPAVAGRTRRRKPDPEPEPEPAPEPEEEQVACDDCGIAMPVSATKCPNPACGAEYDVDPDDAGEAAEAAPAEPAAAVATECWSCQGPVANDKCSSCGIEQQSDEIPF
jgi:hypothetical protein